MTKLLTGIACISLFAATAAEKTVWLDELPAEAFDQDNYSPAKNKSVMGGPLSIAKQTFKRGIGSHANAVGLYQFKSGSPLSFEGYVGVDGYALGKDNGDASLKFIVRADGKTVAESPVMKADTPAHLLKADIRGAKSVELVIEDLGNNSWDLADWCDARFIFEDGAEVVVYDGLTPQLGILTPKPGPAPRINGAKVFGVRPGHEILWKLPVTGERPMTLAAANLPAGARFDAKTGILSGAVAERGTYPIAFTAKNAKGEATSTLKLVVGDRIALTPPMGWNSWNVFANKVTEKNIRDTVDVFADTGLGEHGWSYVNVDDFWQNSVVKTEDRTITGPLRQADGTIAVNSRFPSMKALADYAHAKGFKIGLYSSPGPWTCGRCEGSWKHEWQDAKTYADWGYDYLKYDWCGYGTVQIGEGNNKWTLPYRLMGEALRAQRRDIVFSLCQYGMGDVSTWGENVGGQCWRTTGDINDSWGSMYGILRRQRHLWPYAHPGAWNDPDMLVVGRLGWGRPHPTRLLPNEQYTHMSMWCVLCSPLLIGCDLTQLDDFTRSLLTNDEVLETNQDELGAQAALIAAGPRAEIWAKPMSDGSFVFALVNVSKMVTTVTADFASLGLEGKWRVRDLWRQQDLGTFGAAYETDIPPRATTLVRLFPEPGAGLRAGLTDIRMNNVYFQFQEKRPVDRPGYVAPKGWPCKECPRR